MTVALACCSVGGRYGMLPAVSAEDSLRDRLARLALAAGIPVPDLVVDDERSPHQSPADVERRDGGWRVVVAPALLDAPPAEQDWHLSTALGWWMSPEPRRRRVRGWVVYVAVTVPHVVVGGLALVDDVGIPRWVALLAGPALGFLLIGVTPALARSEGRAFGAAGHPVLVAAGHDPAALTRTVFGGRPDPPWWKRPLSAEPLPSRRIADAEERRIRPAPSLY